MRIFLLSLLLLAFPALGAYDVRVIDGDTVNVPTGVVVGMPGRVSVRLIGIDAPETHGKCPKEKQLAEAAKLYVRDRFSKAMRIKLEFVRWDKYGGRVTGRVNLDGQDLATDLLKSGYAMPHSGGRRDPMRWCK